MRAKEIADHFFVEDDHRNKNLEIMVLRYLEEISQNKDARIAALEATLEKICYSHKINTVVCNDCHSYSETKESIIHAPNCFFMQVQEQLYMEDRMKENDETRIYCGRCGLEQSSCTCKTQINKFEEWCIALKVPDPALDPKLRELILESRRLDYAGLAMNIDGVCIVDAFEMAKDMISELEKK